MARGVSRGEVWMFEFRRPDKLRPVLVLSRAEAIDALHTVVVAPITSTIRGIPSEVLLGQAEGLKHASAVNLDHLHTVEKTGLKQFLGTLRPARLREVCASLAIALGCDD